MITRVFVWATGLWIGLLVTLTIAGCSRPGAPAEALPPPNAIGSRALEDLMGVFGAREAQASIWTEVPFKLGARSFKTVFIQIPNPDEKDAPGTCHSCSVQIGAVTYGARNGEWEVHLRQPDVVHVGQYGRAPDLTNVKIQTIGTTPVLLMESSEIHQGLSGSVVQMIAFDKEWSEIGTISTGEDNATSASCILSNGLRCYKWRGSLKVGTGSPMPDLVIEAQGTQSNGDGTGTIGKPNIVYSFDGAKYIERAVIERRTRLAILDKQADETPTPLRSEVTKIWAKVPLSKEHFLLTHEQSACDVNPNSLSAMAAVVPVTSECVARPPCRPNPMDFQCDLVRVGFDSSGQPLYYQLTVSNRTGEMKLVDYFEQLYGRAGRQVKIAPNDVVTIANEASNGTVAISAVTSIDARAKQYQSVFTYSQRASIASTTAERITPSDPTATSWFGPDVNYTRCIRSRSPADRVRMIQEYGSRAKTNDLAAGVEVAEDNGSGQERVWTYYRTESDCVASLPRSREIPKKYE